MNHLPFVVSLDLEQLFQSHFRNLGLQTDRNTLAEHRKILELSLRRCFANVVIIGEENLTSEVQHLATTHAVELPIINLSGLYLNTGHSLSVNRVVNASGEIIGNEPRRGEPSVDQCITELQKLSLSDAALYDEVIFSGRQSGDIITRLAQAKIRVVKVLCAISIGEGQEYLQEKYGIEIHSVHHFPEVIDQICEHDFSPCAPRSGRVLAESEGTHAPYLLPFGNPSKWASIPEAHANDFSRQILRSTIEMYEAFGAASGRTIECRELERTILVPFDETPITEALKSIYDSNF